MRTIRLAAALGVALVGALPSALAGADSFTPVRLTIRAAPVARLHAPLTISVGVSADPGALDTRSGPLRVRVKLANECGGTFQYTSGVVLLDKQLTPQPSTGHAYSGVASGSGRPAAYGTQTVCTWLDDQGAGRTFASDQSTQINVSATCTRAAARYDAARRQRAGRGTAAKRRRARALASTRRAARRACGPGVPL
jgi:hypothetical protein